MTLAGRSQAGATFSAGEQGQHAANNHLPEHCRGEDDTYRGQRMHVDPSADTAVRAVGVALVVVPQSRGLLA